MVCALGLWGYKYFGFMWVLPIYWFATCGLRVACGGSFFVWVGVVVLLVGLLSGAGVGSWLGRSLLSGLGVLVRRLSG